MSNLTSKNILTIRETVRRSQADGLPLSEYTLRKWTKSGVIPTCQAGTKTLIYYPNVVAYLQGRDVPSAVHSAG